MIPRFVKTQDYDGPNRRSNGEKRLMYWIMGIMSLILMAVTTTSVGFFNKKIEASFAVQENRISRNEAKVEKIGPILECLENIKESLKEIKSDIKSLRRDQKH